MKRRLPRLRCRNLGLIALALILPTAAQAAKFSSAKVTKAINDVRLLFGETDSAPAQPGATVSGSTAVLTGQKSRAELQFPDESLVRLGSNSVFSFQPDRRDVELDKGAMLMQVPKSLGRTNIRTAAVTAAITGTTILFEYVPPVLDARGKVIKPGTVKIIVVEGSLEFELNAKPGQKLRLLPGEMVAFRSDTKRLPRKFQIDLQRLVKTSDLVDGGLGQLPDLPLMQQEITAQNQRKKSGQLVEVSSGQKPKGHPLAGSSAGQAINQTRVTVNSRPTPPPTIIQRIFRPRTAPTGPSGPAPVVLPERPDRDPPGTGTGTPPQQP